MKENYFEYWIKEASNGRNIAECWQACYHILNKEKEKIYASLIKIADENEFEDMRREITRYFLNLCPEQKNKNRPVKI
mgnify:CR=1 FL=1